MDAASAQLQPYQPSSGVIPAEIYQSLFDIAKQGYDANDVTNWYLAVKRDLQQLNTAPADTSYSLTPPFSVCSPVPPDHETQPPNTPLESTLGPQSFYGTPTNNPNLWSEAFLTDPFHQNQIIATTSAGSYPAQICTTTAAEQGGFLELSSPWSATAPAFPTIQPSIYPPAAGMASLQAPLATNHAQYYHSDPYSITIPGSRKRRASQPPPSYVPMSRTSIAFAPNIDPAVQANSSPFSTTPSGEISYLPISVIPSRKRRKTLPKGMKKVIQPVQVQRQT